MMHSSSVPASMPARRIASATTDAPSWVAVKPLSAPRNFPVGVRTALTMTESRTANLDAIDDIRAEKRLKACENRGRRSHHFTRPLQRRGFDDQQLALQLDLGRPLERGPHRSAPRKADFAVGQRRLAQ